MIDVEPHDRNCFLLHEKNLTLFKVYNEANCKAECKSNFVAAECGCVPEYLVAKASIPICKSTRESCVNAADLNFKSEIIRNCDCLPSCGHLKYVARRLISDFTNTSPQLKQGGLPAVYFNIWLEPGDHFPIVSRKHFTTTDIFAFIGGLLGLFLGISVVTFAEVVNVLLQPLFEKLSSLVNLRKKSSNSNLHRTCFSKATDKAKSYFSFYLKESSIHTFNFIADSSNWLERIFWFISFSLSMSGCFVMIVQLYLTMDFKSVSFVIEDRIDVSEIPFPAVTIFGRFPFELDVDELNMTHFETGDHPASRITAIHYLATHDSFFGSHSEDLNFYDHEKFIVEEMKGFSKVEWFRNQEGSFGKFSSAPFAETLTIKGSAFTFNILDFDDLMNTRSISNDFRYRRNIYLGDHLRSNKDKFPWHASKAASLELQLTVAPFHMPEFSEAFTVHPSNELPMMQAKYHVFEFAGGKHLEVSITPNAIISDDSLKSLELSDRLCYLEGERKLKFFKVYTKHNCEIECLANNIESEEGCSCIPFDLVRGPDSTVCGNDKYACDDIDIRDLKATEDLVACNCLPPCSLVSYDIEITESKLREHEFDNITQLSFKFASEDFNPLLRTRQFTVIDFLCYVGGLLGLFAGISVLSLFEIFYFFTLRMLTNVWGLRKQPQHAIVAVKPVHML